MLFFFLSRFQFIYYILNAYFVSFVVKRYRHKVDKFYAWEMNSISTRAFVLIPPLLELFIYVSHAWEMNSISTRAFVLIPPLLELFIYVSHVLK